MNPPFGVWWPVSNFSLLPSGAAQDQLVFRALRQFQPLGLEQVALLTDLIAVSGWRPHATTGGNGSTTLLGSIVDRFPHKAYDPAAPLMEFPTALPAFEAYSRSLSKSRFNAQWFFGLAVASGATPWTDPDASVPAYKRQLLLIGLMNASAWDALVQILALPDAPSLQALLDQPLANPYGGATTLGGRLVGMEHGHWGLGHLLARHAYTPSMDAWKHATPAALAVLLQHAPFPSDPKKSQAIEQAWSRRLKEKTITSSDYSALVEQSLAGSSQAGPSPDELQALGVVKHYLQHGWGKKIPVVMYGSKPTDGTADLSPAVLTMKVDVSGTKLDGTWTPLTASWARDLRSLSWNGLGGGVLPTRFVHWFLPQRSDLDWGHALEGVLKDSLGVQWRPGVSLDGLIALVLLARKYEKVANDCFDTAQRRIERNQKDLSGLKPDCVLLGIQDVEAFCRSHRESAVRFTEMALERVSKPGAEALATAWSTALVRLPDWLDDAPELGARLLKALVRDGNQIELPMVGGMGEPQRRQLDTTGNGRSALGLVMQALQRPYHVKGPTTFSPGHFGLQEHGSDVQELFAEMAIAYETPDALLEFQAAAQKGLLSDRVVERFKGWYEHNQRRPKRIDGMRGQWAIVRGLVLNHALPASAASGQKPRF